MELRNLNTFKVVVEAKGFTRAAELLGYAQSSVTAQIQALEEELGTPLFDRLGKKIVLTEAGKRLLPYAVEMLKMQDSAKQVITMDETPSGTLTIGAPESLTAYRLPPIIQEYRELYPQVKIILKPAQCWDLPNLLRSGDVDIAFLLADESHYPDLIQKTLIREPMVLIAPINHPLAEKPRIEPEDLEKETLLNTEPGCSYRAQFEQYLQRNGIIQANMLEFWNIEAIKKCVMCGIGISVLPLITVESELRDKKIIAMNWDDQAVQVSTQVLYHKSKWLSPALQEFLQIVGVHGKSWLTKKAVS